MAFDLTKMLADVSRFNLEVIGTKPPEVPTALTGERLKFRLGVFEEEMSEFDAACCEGDLPEAADALIDLIYYALGGLYEMGVKVDPVWDEVQKRNLEKARGKKARKISSDQDAVKPEDWKSPDHSWLNFLSYVLVEAAQLRAEKTADYEGGDITKADYFPFMMYSHGHIIWTKALRMKSLIIQMMKDQGVEPNFESLRDTFLDLINYATYAVEDFDGNLDGRTKE